MLDNGFNNVVKKKTSAFEIEKAFRLSKSYLNKY